MKIISLLANMDALSKAIAIAIGITTLAGVIIKACAWIKKKRCANVDQQKVILKRLDELCSGQSDLEKQMKGIGERLDTMDNERTDAREEDAYVRTRMYLGTVAILDALMLLAEHEGLEINGDVAQYRKENIENLKNGRGILRTPKKGGR